MKKIFRKRIPRELKAHFAKYMALMFLIMMGMYVVTALVAGAETIITRTEEYGQKNCVEEGEFSTLQPLSHKVQKEITDMGYTLEEMYYTDILAKDDSTLRMMKVRKHINQIELDAGRMPKETDAWEKYEWEAVLEKQYAAKHQLEIGDKLETEAAVFSIVGIGSTPDYDAPFENFSDTAIFSENFGTLFVIDDCYEKMTQEAGKGERYCYAYLLGKENTSAKLKHFLQKASKLLFFVEKKDNVRIAGAAGDMVINKMAGLTAGVLVMVLFTYVISVFVMHQIQQESSVIGTLYALGIKKKELLFHYITLPTVLAFIGGIIGALLGISPLGADRILQDTYAYYSLPAYRTVYPSYLVLYSLLMPAGIAILVNVLVIWKKMSKTALSLMRNTKKIQNNSKVVLKKGSFIKRFQIRVLLREKRTSITVFLGMAGALLVLMLGLDCYTLCLHVQKAAAQDIQYEFMYLLQAPIEEVPKEGEICYVKNLSKEMGGYTLEISIMGLTKENSYFPTVRVEKGQKLLTISSAVAQKYNLHIGDTWKLTDTAEEKEYLFTIAEIAPYQAGLTVFMELESMRELFGAEKDYYNCVLSKKALHFAKEVPYTMTTKKDLEQASGIFVKLMSGMITMLLFAAVIIYSAVMYLMQDVMIERASYGISLLKTFGYRMKEIRSMYLHGNRYTLWLGILIGIPASKFVIDKIFPLFILNVASGCQLVFPWYLYCLIGSGMLVLYGIINKILVRKLEKITPEEILKQRE